MESLLKGFLKETERSSDRIALIILKNEGECVVTYKELR